MREMLLFDCIKLKVRVRVSQNFGSFILRMELPIRKNLLEMSPKKMKTIKVCNINKLLQRIVANQADKKIT